MVVRKRQRQHEPRRKGLAVPYRLRLRFRYAEDRDFGRVDDRRERGAADSAERADRKAAALHVGGAELAFARLRGELAHLLRNLQNALLIGVLDDRHDEAVRRVRREADMEVLFEDEVAADRG